MAGTYGEPGKNPFTVKGVGGILSPVVNGTTGVTQVYRQGAANTYQSLGTLNPATNKFTADPNAGSLTQNEIKALSSEESIKTIKNSASTTVSKGVQAAGGTPEKGQAAANKLLSPNKAQQGGTGDGTATPVATPVEVEKSTFDSAANTNKGISGTLKYPANIADSQDKIKFDILEYSPRGLTTGGFQSEGGAGAFGLSERNSGRKAIATIFLPIPGGISDTNTAGWGDDKMNAFQLIGANTALQSITQGLQKGASVLSEAAESTSTPAGSNESKSALAAAFAGFALQGEGSQILSRTTGQVLNPNLELLFTGPELRSFNFTFKMSARSQPEANDIVKIIRMFKQSMSSQRSKAQLFAKAPNTFRIQYLHKNGPDHTRIGKIKECALVSMTTNYTPEGQYATYGDGTPISYEIQLQFKELEPVFNDEYGALGDSHIGY